MLFYFKILKSKSNLKLGIEYGVCSELYLSLQSKSNLKLGQSEALA